MNLARLIGVLALALGLALAGAACDSPQTALLGKWQQVDGSSTVEFLRDGTVIQSGLITSTGKYQPIEGNRVKVEFSGLAGLLGAQVLKFEVTGDRLVLTPEGGTARSGQEYTRVK